MENKENLIKFTLDMCEAASKCVVDMHNTIYEYRKRRQLHQRKLMLIKKKQLALISSILLNKRRQCWALKRPRKFWEKDCQKNGPEFFKENFRMSTSSFKELCKLLQTLKKDDTNFRRAICLEKRVAIALYALGSSIEFKKIANLFGVGKSTVCKCFNEFCQEVWKTLLPLYISALPLNSEEVQEQISGFERLGFPQCLGAIDTCHIKVKPEFDNADDYYNSKDWYSMVLFALVDFRCRFLYINVGNPGRVKDSDIFENSSLKQQLDNCSVLEENSKVINGVKVPVLVLGDAAFKFSTRVMKPYSCDDSANIAQKTFNNQLSKCRKVVDNAFEQLKARFPRIGKGIDSKIDNASSIIRTCCVLHNFLYENNDVVNKDWIRDFKTQQQASELQQPEEITTENDDDRNGEKIRRCLARLFNTQSESSENEIGSADSDDNNDVNIYFESDNEYEYLNDTS
ncbi:protein ANTAGONIST OF LIKE HETEROCHROMATIN PROTEIN 1-like [Teleopsis dalmanni]|uniref:protein ANTAGONIST OF LIKE HETEROCHROMATIN PROTEIN 1-like n=1 Tax=Teleopsis dalmanni TaxID=139649 RepID=UPI0018CF236D|nr:protein ANTAGONIST OF LIKE HETEROCHROMATIN PROTEIN 1-like [Teleopsis dalmanni]XP_037954805.1 protein ANTAGONIST OF LIKE HETEROCHROMATIN PROTEIN 1-like [Teleopsis dalmanni]